MVYVEVWPADSRFHGDRPLTYSSDGKLTVGSVVHVPLKQKVVIGIVAGQVKKPSFNVKPVKDLVSPTPLPQHLIDLTSWLSDYYGCTAADALRLLVPPTIAKPRAREDLALSIDQAQIEAPLTQDQKQAVEKISHQPGNTFLLHGETGSGKTRVYLELAARALKQNRSVIFLTPEISLTTQLATAAQNFLNRPVFIIHSQMTVSARKKTWLQILESTEPVVVVGPRSALFSPIKKLGLIVVDEAHEPAYKQDQTPTYSATRVASKLAVLCEAKVILGSATPDINDYFVAQQKKAIVRMTQPAIAGSSQAVITPLDLKQRDLFAKSAYLSKPLIDAIKSTLSANKQMIIYLNRRGSARLILCQACGWRLLCPNCDIAPTYHSDHHQARCHICGWKSSPPVACPTCSSPSIIYKGAGTKAIVEELTSLFPEANIMRFDSDSPQAESLNNLYREVVSGKIDILVGTQLLAKGLDLPRLALVGVINSDSALALPDFSSEERSYQLLYQIIGRVGRGHGRGQVIIQTFEPDSDMLRSAIERKWADFYTLALAERQQFKFPPYCFLARLRVKRASAASAKSTAEKMAAKIKSLGLPVEIIGPTPAFYARRGKAYYYQIILKAKSRQPLLEAAALAEGWHVDLDPISLL